MAIGLVSEEIFPKTLFFSQSGQQKSFSFKKLKNMICNMDSNGCDKL